MNSGGDTEVEYYNTDYRRHKAPRRSTNNLDMIKLRRFRLFGSGILVSRYELRGEHKPCPITRSQIDNQTEHFALLAGLEHVHTH